MMYILDEDKNPIHIDLDNPQELVQWGKFFGDIDKRRVARTDINESLYVSTVFLGSDHNFYGHGEPILFETMVFRDGEGCECERYCTWEEAKAGHETIVANIRLLEKSEHI